MMQAAAAQITPYQIRRDCTREPLVYDGVHPELCPRLLEIIDAHRATTRARTGSLNVGGWKSPETLFSWPELEIAELARAVIGVVHGKPIGWAMINVPGAVHKRHQHQAAIISGLYYLDWSKTPTLFELPDRTKLEIEPAPGRLVVFHAEMWHSVPAVTDQKRVTISFDVRR
jgi:hypothetical protein